MEIAREPAMEPEEVKCRGGERIWKREATAAAREWTNKRSNV
jgi:hypothetical protein